MVELLITFFLGLCCGILFFKLGVPGGMMVGAIAGVSLLSVLTGMAYMPPETKLAAQCMAGAFIACSMDRGDLRRLPEIWKPALALLGAVLVLNITLGFLIFLCSPLDLLTSLMCAVPGGMSDIPIIAADMCADAPKVAVMQFVRMFAGIGVFPIMIARLTREETRMEMSDESGDSIVDGPSQSGTCSRLFPVTLIIAGFCGVLGKYLKIPAGPLIFSMIGVITFKLLTGRAYLPIWVKRLAQVLSGAYIGCGITRADLIELRYLLLPAILLLFGYFLNSILTGKLLHRLFGIPLKVGMLAATPAGATDMALISADLGVKSKVLIELQIVRLIVVVSIFPQIIYAVAGLFE